MSPPGCQKMSATPCNRNAEESFPVLSLKSREQKPPNSLLIQDKNVLQPRAYPMADTVNASIVEHFRTLEDPRIERTKKHNLLDILVIALCTLLTGGEGFQDRTP